MGANLVESLDYIIKNKQIKTVFQPIISLNKGSVLGHEALSRMTCPSEIENIEMLFKIAADNNRIWDLEHLCRTTTFETAHKFMVPPHNKKLFLNVNPNTLYDQSFRTGFTKETLTYLGIPTQNVIIEITERDIIKNSEAFLKTIKHYREQEYKIAIDDAGSGYSGLNLISETRPHYIKLDMKLIRNIDKDSLKYAIVKGMVEISKVSNINLIAEGIESYEELVTLINLGVQYGQGYYIQKPDPKLKEISEDIVETIKDINLMRNVISNKSMPNISIKNISMATKTINKDKKVCEIYDFFKDNPGCFGVCVLDGEVPIGIITQEKLTLKLSGQYGFTLYQNKTLEHVMDEDFLCVDYKTPISEVSYMAMARKNDKLYDFIVVTENDKYLGTVTVKDLLEKTSELKVNMAKYQSPLTGLPGNLLIEQKLTECIADKKDYSVVYFDIDNFKAYNDVYGFENGDLIIRLLAEILKENFGVEDFVGHIGGDDFVLILNWHIDEDYLEKIVEQFEDDALKFYGKTDIELGYIVANNRQGDIEKFPLLSVTCVIVNSAEKDFNNIYELTKHLSTLKSEKKHYRRIARGII